MQLVLEKVQPRSQALSPLPAFVVGRKTKLSRNHYIFKATFRILILLTFNWPTPYMKYIGKDLELLHYPTQGDSIAVKNGIYMNPVGGFISLQTLKGP